MRNVTIAEWRGMKALRDCVIIRAQDEHDIYRALANHGFAEASPVYGQHRSDFRLTDRGAAFLTSWGAQ